MGRRSTLDPRPRKTVCKACSPARPCEEHRLAELRAEVAAVEARKPRCPGCGCAGRTCRVVLADDAGEGVCAPAGTSGMDRCSACLPREAA